MMTLCGSCRSLVLSLIVTVISIGTTCGSLSSWAKDVPSAESYIASYVGLVFRTYSDSLTRAFDLQHSVEDLLENPNDSTLQNAKNSWLVAREPYGKSEAFRFYGGPIDFYDSSSGFEGPEGRLNSWPLDEAYIDYVRGNPTAGIIGDISIPLTRDVLLGQNQVDDDRSISTGYHAIEFLLWGQDLTGTTGGLRPVSDFVPGTTTNDRRRRYLDLVVAQLVDDLAFLVKEWTPGSDNYAGAFHSMPEGVALEKILTGLLTMSQFELASERMAVPLDSGDPEDEHSCFSDNTHNDFMYNAIGIENVYFGRYDNYSGVGISDLIKLVNPGLDDQMAAALMHTKASIEKIGAPFDVVLSTPYGSSDRENVETAIDALMAQAVLLKEIGMTLDLSVRITDGEEG